MDELLRQLVTSNISSLLLAQLTIFLLISNIYLAQFSINRLLSRFDANLKKYIGNLLRMNIGFLNDIVGFAGKLRASKRNSKLSKEILRFIEVFLTSKVNSKLPREILDLRGNT